MSDVTIQMGHVARTRGATGTHREQEFTKAIGNALTRRLRELGHAVRLIGADDAVPRGDVFVALHTDGSLNPARQGASVGYPDTGGQRLASAWKRHHQSQGYPGGWLADNYTAALRGYYGFGKAAAAGGYEHRFLAEHGTTTNAADCAWIEANIAAITQAHVDAIGEVVGHPHAAPATPTPSPTPSGDDDMDQLPILRRGSTGQGVRNLQGLLLAAGRRVAVDGDFGPGTEAILREYQVASSAPGGADGVAGSGTWGRLLGLR